MRLDNKKPSSQALVIGAGVAGIKAALELAELGHGVYLCDRRPYAGGTLLGLDRWFPDNHCGLCKVLPVFARDLSSQHCLRRGLSHPLIELVSPCEIVRLDGSPGGFSVTVNMLSSGVSPQRCIGCGRCARACPVEVPDDFNRGLTRRKAIYLGNPLALPKIFTIDTRSCTRCGACVEVCPTEAIDPAMQTRERCLQAGAVIVSTGFEAFDPRSASRYGYGRFANVITGLELERMLSGSGPTGGELLRPSDNARPRTVAFLQCVGSRTLDRNFCSSACCMFALKEAMMLKQRWPDIDARIFFMDMRAFGKGYHRYYEQARSDYGIGFSRCRVPRVMQNFKTGDLTLCLTVDDGLVTSRQFDMVVLSTGQAPSPGFTAMAETLGLEVNRWGFCNTREGAPAESTREGIFVCGSAGAPGDIADAIAGAGAAAGQASLLLAAHGGPEDVAGEQAPVQQGKTAVVICSCGGELEEGIDLPGLLELCRSHPGVGHVETAAYLCRPEECARARQAVREAGATGVVCAGCSALMPRMLAEDVPVEVVNVREELAWVHQQNPAQAATKARTLVSMAIARLGHAGSPVVPRPAQVVPRALVVGGGLAGLTAALAVARRGHEVEMVERESRLGGNALQVAATLQGWDVRKHLQSLIACVGEHPRIAVRMDTALEKIEGHAGSFSARLHGADAGETECDAGVVILATGAQEARTREYLAGSDERVVTQRELEQRLHSAQLDPMTVGSLAMIQCVGSRETDRPYCSRVCCAQALRNALALRARNPAMQIVIYYRDMMSYGFVEQYYTHAREQGIVFARYGLQGRPDVAASGEKLAVSVPDAVLGGSITQQCDLVVLSTGIAPRDNRALASLLDVALDQDGFFQEAETKFRPVDMLRDGVFVCGLAHSPRNAAETIMQAQAAASRASLILSRSRLVSGRDVSEVNATWCSGCELCIGACPYGARVKNADEGVVEVIEVLCQGCGACASICPNKAAGLRGHRGRQILAALDAAL